MGKVCKKSWIVGIFLGVMLFAAGFAFQATTVDTQAATNGFRTISGKTYYYKNGKIVKGWLTLNGKKYYLNRSTGALYKGWMRSSKGTLRYYDSRTGAMYTGFQKIAGKYYYFNKKTGFSVGGFVKFGNNFYRYFNTKTYAMATGWMTNNKNQKWYFGSDGKMYRSLNKIGSYYYYFDGKTGAARDGFVKSSAGNVRFFRRKYYRMATGWLTNGKGQKRYFKSNGVMAVGKYKVDGSTYYFNKNTGIATGGWVTIDGSKYYFDTKTFKMVTGSKTIDGVRYQFSSTGVMTYEGSSDSEVVDISYFKNDPKPVGQTGSKTIKNYLAGALKPVGQALYIWGGGWYDSTLKGVKSNWQKFYLNQSSSYDYNNYRDLSTTNRAKGLDCSGFVGWAAYQVMQTRSNVGYGYTVVSGDIGNYYRKTLGWGTVVNQNYLSQHNYKLYPGDIGYDDGHTWIVLGQCSDRSAVIIHSTPNAGVQIAGTPTPEGKSNSQAAALAKKYMSRYAGYKKYEYHTTTGNFIRRGNYMRWYPATLSDPDGFKYKTADQILKIMFGF